MGNVIAEESTLDSNVFHFPPNAEQRHGAYILESNYHAELAGLVLTEENLAELHRHHAVKGDMLATLRPYQTL